MHRAGTALERSEVIRWCREHRSKISRDNINSRIFFIQEWIPKIAHICRKIMMPIVKKNCIDVSQGINTVVHFIVLCRQHGTSDPL